jgi:hypothetical protein
MNDDESEFNKKPIFYFTNFYYKKIKYDNPNNHSYIFYSHFLLLGKSGLQQIHCLVISSLIEKEMVEPFFYCITLQIKSLTYDALILNKTNI